MNNYCPTFCQNLYFDIYIKDHVFFILYTKSIGCVLIAILVLDTLFF